MTSVALDKNLSACIKMPESGAEEGGTRLGSTGDCNNVCTKNNPLFEVV